MATLKAGEPFGLDNDFVEEIDWDIALKRILHDLRSDFIFAPHLAFVYEKAGQQLVELLKSELKSGKFSPGVPLTIEVPKSFRIRVAAGQSSRLGPSYSRPGSILMPRDRLLYQALADQAAPFISKKSDLTRSFSHKLEDSKSASMFVPTRICWNELQSALASHAESNGTSYILKLDIANFFGSLNQHKLINVLSDAGYPQSLASRLEAILTSYTGERSSRGILQGMYPSDLLGNYYMAPIDQFFGDHEVPSARYVDDIYIFVESVDAAEKLLRELIPTLRSYDLGLNEAKSVIMPKSSLVSEEPDLEALFKNAVSEISTQIDEADFDADYGFQSDWDDGESGAGDDDENELELIATTILFDSASDYPGHEESIERFCLPLFAKANSDYAVDYVLEAFSKRPAMSQIYAAYLARFLDSNEVMSVLVKLLEKPLIADWQKVWLLAAISQAGKPNDLGVKVALSLLKDANKHEALRAVAATYVGLFGDHSRRMTLRLLYPSLTEYIQAAVYYSSKSWPGVEKNNAKAQWSSLGSLNKLLSAAMGN